MLTPWVATEDLVAASGFEATYVSHGIMLISQANLHLLYNVYQPPPLHGQTKYPATPGN